MDHQQMRAPLGMARWTLYLLLALVAVLLAWAFLGQLDIVASAQGKLVPATQIKIVQPAEAGIVKAILVREGDAVRKDQVLIRMDAVLSEADSLSVESDYQTHLLSLRRIEAELSGAPLQRLPDDPEPVYSQVSAQYEANRLALEAAVSEAASQMKRSHHEMVAAQQIRSKLAQTLPHYQTQEKAFAELADKGFSGKILAADKVRERIEKEQDLRTQEAQILAAQATIDQARRRMVQLQADYQQRLQAERLQVGSRLQQLTQERAKLAHRAAMLELRAPQDGIIKNLATHTVGSVVSQGSILMTLVPVSENLLAEVWVRNDDIGFVAPGQPVRVKLAAFPFQKYGMLDGRIAQVSADAAEETAQQNPAQAGQLFYKARITLLEPHLLSEDKRHRLSPGMQVTAEITLGRRSVMEYLVSPVSRAFQQAGRER
jgi:hemolysin D